MFTAQKFFRLFKLHTFGANTPYNDAFDALTHFLKDVEYKKYSMDDWYGTAMLYATNKQGNVNYMQETAMESSGRIDVLHFNQSVLSILEEFGLNIDRDTTNYYQMYSLQNHDYLRFLRNVMIFLKIPIYKTAKLNGNMIDGGNYYKASRNYGNHVRIHIGKSD